MPFREFLVEVTLGACYVGALPADSMAPILGDTFLRSVYVAFDQDRGAVFLAHHRDCGFNEQLLPVGKGAVAEFVGEWKAESAAVRGGARCGGGVVHGGVGRGWSYGWGSGFVWACAVIVEADMAHISFFPESRYLRILLCERL